MKKTLLLTLLFLFSLSCGHSKKSVPQSDNATVKVCTGKYARRFHDHNCRGLESCKGEIISITLEKAKKDGYTACGYCYK